MGKIIFSKKNSDLFDFMHFSEWILKVFGLYVFIFIISSCNHSPQITFKHHIIDSPLTAEVWGTGGFTLADYDKDGDLDVTIQCRSDSAKVYWYENRGIDNWIRHFVGIGSEYQLGATAFDVDRDSNVDLVLGHVWFRNSGNLQNEPDVEWEEHYYNGDMLEENHDIVTADLNLDNIDEIIMYNQTSSTLRAYNLTDPFNWTYADIASDVDENYVHSGIFPNGVVDLNNDNYPDVIMPIYWYKNPGMTGTSWEKVAYPYTPIVPNPYGAGMRVWAGEMNDDGLNDFIYADCDVQFSKVYLLINEGKGESWIKEELPLPKSNVGESGSFHSMQVADFDNDGDLDVFSGEQEDDTKLMKPEGLWERGIIFQNIGTLKKPKFEAIIINEDNPGWHDALIGDVDGDGDIDIVSKIWKADEIDFHLDYWENKTK